MIPAEEIDAEVAPDDAPTVITKADLARIRIVSAQLSEA